MNKTFQYIILTCTLATALLSACVKDDFGGRGADTDGDEIEYTVSFSTPGWVSPEVTRGEFLADDRIVESICVLVYNVDEVTGKETFAYHRNAVSVASGANGNGTFKIRLARSGSGEKYSFDFFANVELADNLNKFNIGDERESVFSQLNKVRYTWLVPYDDKFPAWAYVLAVELQRDTNFNTVNFKSALVKFDIGFNWPSDDQPAGGLPNFKLTGLELGLSTSAFYFLPHPDNYDPSTDKITAPTPYAHVYTNGALTGITGIEDDFVKDGLYFQEPDVDLKTKIVSGEINQFSVILGGILFDDGGNPIGTRYFPLRIKDPDNPGKNLPYIRGHRYRVNIIRIEGTGYETSSEAMMADSEFDISYELTVHEEGDINHIVFSDTNYLGINILSETFDANGGAGELKVRTDVTGGWTVSFEDENGANPSWITTSSSLSGAADATATLSYTVASNFVDYSPRTAFARFKAGVLEINTRIHQDGAWFIKTDYNPALNINGEGDEFTVSVWGDVPPSVWVRTYSERETIGNYPARASSLCIEMIEHNDLGFVLESNKVAKEIQVIGNAWLPMAPRVVQFQYSTDEGATWITFEEGIQNKGHYTLYTTGRVVSLYNMQDENGGNLSLNWSEAMGIDPYFQEEYLYSHENSTCYIPVGWRTFPIEYYAYPYLNAKHNYGYTPTEQTGCNIYYEESEDYEIYGKGKWRLPTRIELVEMIPMIDHIGDLPLSGKYSCSYEDIPDQMFANNLISGTGDIERKIAVFRVRCVLDDGGI